MQPRGPTLLLPIEERNRELNSRAIIAMAALERGFEVVVGQQWEIFAQIDSLPPSIVLFKGNNAVQGAHMERAKRAGHRIASTEEEAFGVSHPRLILRCYSPAAVTSADLIFTNGGLHEQVLRTRWPELARRLVCTGNPRADILWTEDTQPDLNDASRRLAERFGSFVLINTNFASINPVIDDAYGSFELCVRVGWLQPNDPEDIRLLRAQYDWERTNFDAVLELAIKLTRQGVKVVLRPHPSENGAIWRDELADIDLLTITNEGDQLDWMRASQLLVHTGCTTGFESFLMNHPTVSLAPGENEWHEVMISNQVNTRLTNVGDAMDAITRHLDGTHPIIAREKGVMDRLDDFVRIGETSSAERIAQSLLDLAPEIKPWTSNDFQEMGGRAKTLLSDRRRAKVEFDDSDLKRAVAGAQPSHPSAGEVSVTVIAPSLYQLAVAHV